MSFDGIVTHAVVDELQKILASGRVTKIHQPHHTEVILQIRAQGRNHRVLISINAQFARIHLTEEKYENPQTPPMFCMVLRKHLDGSFVESIKQVEFERIIHIDFSTRDELGDIKTKRLILELMGRHSNLILIDPDSDKIIDCIKHLPPSVNRFRTVLPGQPYVLPPEQDKLNPLEMDEMDLIRRLDFNAGKLDRQLVNHISGFSPLIAKEILFRAGLPNKSSLVKAFFNLTSQINEKDFKPQIIRDPQGKDIFHVLDLTHQKRGRVERYVSVSEMLEQFFMHKAESDMVKQKANDLRRFISNEWQKNKTKLIKLQQTRQNAEEAATYQLYGELLTAHMHLMKKGDKEIAVTNYYDENQSSLTIPLDPEKTPSENAQNYFKKYNKAKHAKQVLEGQIEETENEILYFDSLLQQIDSASLKDVAEIREELEEGGYLKKRQTKAFKKKPQTPSIDQYVSTDGTLILVGKNNKQNEYLTNRLASPHDTWLHTKDIPGSHVVIRSQKVSDETLLEAATLAAYFSKSKHSSNVPVDYTEIRHVRKPNGAKPGYVIYDHQNTLFVTPDESILSKLKKQPSHA